MEPETKNKMDNFIETVGKNLELPDSTIEQAKQDFVKKSTGND